MFIIIIIIIIIKIMLKQTMITNTPVINLFPIMNILFNHLQKIQITHSNNMYTYTQILRGLLAIIILDG